MVWPLFSTSLSMSFHMFIDQTILAISRVLTTGPFASKRLFWLPMTFNVLLQILFVSVWHFAIIFWTDEWSLVRVFANQVTVKQLLGWSSVIAWVIRTDKLLIYLMVIIDVFVEVSLLSELFKTCRESAVYCSFWSFFFITRIVIIMRKFTIVYITLNIIWFKILALW